MSSKHFYLRFFGTGIKNCRHLSADRQQSFTVKYRCLAAIYKIKVIQKQVLGKIQQRSWV